MERTARNPDEVQLQNRDSSVALVLTVVLPVLNEARDIGRLLGELRSQDFPQDAYEVIVVDGGSSDDTRVIVQNLVESWPNLALLDNPKRRSGPARNIGARHARGVYLLFLDGHCSLPRNDYLTRLVEIFVESGAHCLCRPQPLVDLADGKWANAIALARHSPLGHNPGSDIYSEAPGFTDPRSAGAAYERNIVRQLGGYDERFDACEDVEFNHRVFRSGFSAYRHPDLAVHYRPRATLVSLFQQMMRYGRGRAHLLARHPSTVPWPLIMLTGAVFAVIVGPIVWGGAGLLASLVLVGLWILVLAVEGARLAGFGGDGVRVSASLYAIHSGLLAGFCEGLGRCVHFRTPMISDPLDSTQESQPDVS